MTPGSSWKGNLRAAAIENLLLSPAGQDERGKERLELIDIFGDEKGHDTRDISDQTKQDMPLARYLDRFAPFPTDEMTGRQIAPAGRKGRIRLLPSYYNGVDLDILNPRDRATRAGTNPIVMEVVPVGTKGRFGIIYLPFDLIGRPENEIRGPISRDWKLIGEAIRRMFRVSGFGAKKSSGCGKARQAISAFRFECRLPGFRAAVATSFDDVRILHGSFGAE